MCKIKPLTQEQLEETRLKLCSGDLSPSLLMSVEQLIREIERLKKVEESFERFKENAG